MTRALGLIKPCAVSKGLEAKIFEDIKASGLRVTESKRLAMTSELVDSFYAEHKGKVFFSELKHYMTSGDVVAFIVEGDDVINKYRALMGATNPNNAEVGTLRQKYGESLDNNAVHGSDSESSAAREIKIIFG